MFKKKVGPGDGDETKAKEPDKNAAPKKDTKWSKAITEV